MRRGRDGCKEEEPKAYLTWDAKLENQRDNSVCQLTPLDTEKKSSEVRKISQPNFLPRSNFSINYKTSCDNIKEMKSLRKSQTKEFKTSKMSEIVYLKFKADRRNLQISRIQFFITNFRKVTRKSFSPKGPHVRHKLKNTHQGASQIFFETSYTIFQASVLFVA